MEARMQNVERRLQSLDNLQETVLSVRDEMQEMGRTFSQELQAMMMEIRSIAHGPPSEKTMTELTRIRQSGTLAEFKVRFDAISAKVDLPEAYLVDIYVGALKEEIAESVIMFDPRTLVEARRLARVQEIAINHRMSKKRIPSIKNVPQEHVVIQGCDGNFMTDQDSFIDIGSTSTLNFKTQGSVADRSYASSFPSNTEFGYVEITFGVNGTWCLDSGRGVQERNRRRESDGGRLPEPFGQDPRFFKPGAIKIYYAPDVNAGRYTDCAVEFVFFTATSASVACPEDFTRYCADFKKEGAACGLYAEVHVEFL